VSLSAQTIKKSLAAIVVPKGKDHFVGLELLSDKK